MATLGSINKPNSDKNFFGSLFDPTKLQALKPTTNGISIIRPIPEITADGRVLPMVQGTSPDGLDFSNIKIESIINSAGLSNKFTGFTRPSDVEDTNVTKHFFGLLFIKLRGQQKAGTLDQLPPAFKAKIVGMLEKKLAGKQKVASAATGTQGDYGMMQSIVLQVDGKPCPTPRIKQAVLLSKTASASLNKLLESCYKQGIDVFSPDKGYTIKLVGVPPDLAEGRSVPVFRAELGDPVALPLAQCTKLWVPWDSAMNLHDSAWHVKELCKCFGRDIVEYVFPDEFAMYCGAPAIVQHPAPAVGQQAANVTQPPASGVQQAAVTKPPVTLAIPDEMPPPMESGDDDTPDEQATQTPAGSVVTQQPLSAEDMKAKYRQLLDGLPA